MMRRLLMPALLLALGFGVLATVPTRAAEPTADAAKIAKLIEQLGSSTFDEREQANKDLDAIGVPALEALRKAAKSDDAEVSRRASSLVAKIEKIAEAKTVLKPTKIHLVFKETPITEAIADIKKKTGYNVVIHDPENKLKDRTVTLDTGETTFWQAFDQFCDKAGVHEATQQELIQPIVPVKPGLPPQIQPLPINPGGPIKILPVNPNGPIIQIVPAPNEPGIQIYQIKPVEVAPVEKTAPPKVEKGEKPGAALLADDAVPAAKPAVQPAPPVAAQPAVQPGVRPGGAVGGVARPPVRILPQQPGQITIVDGKSEAEATDYSSAVRVRAQTKNTIYGNAPEGQLLFALEISPEPKITLQSLIGLKLDKAIDDNDQKLGEAMLPAQPGIGGPGGGVFPGGGAPGIAQPAIAIGRPMPFLGNRQLFLTVRLKKGDKASKSIKELSGTISAEVLPEAKTLIKTDEILKSAGKTFKGEDGGSIKIVSVDKDETTNQVKVVFEFEAPAGYVANANALPGFTGPGVPVPLPANPPPLPPAKGIKPAGAGFQAVQVQAAPAQVQIQIQVGGGVAVAPIRPIGGGFNQMPGLRLVDDKGTPVEGQNIIQQVKQPAQPGGQFTVEWVLTFPVKKDQTEAGKFTFSASKPVTVDIPFNLKDIVLP